MFLVNDIHTTAPREFKITIDGPDLDWFYKAANNISYINKGGPTTSASREVIYVDVIKRLIMEGVRSVDNRAEDILYERVTENSPKQTDEIESEE